MRILLHSLKIMGKCPPHPTPPHPDSTAQKKKKTDMHIDSYFLRIMLTSASKEIINNHFRGKKN